MSTDRSQRLSPDELALKIATADAVRAAGGQDFVAENCGRSQGVVSDYCSRTTRSFMPLDIVAKVEALGTGAPGAPHITRALARAQGLPLEAPRVAVGEGFDLGDWMAWLARESADVMACLAGEDLSARCESLSVSAREKLCRELDQIEHVIEQMRHAMAAGGASNGATGRG